MNQNIDIISLVTNEIANERQAKGPQTDVEVDLLLVFYFLLFF